MKKLSLILVFALILGLLAGCAGTPVIYYTECDCPEGSHEATPAPENKPEAKPEDNTPAEPAGDGALKTGLYLTASVSEELKFDATMVAVLVDDNGVIVDCIIDSVSESVAEGTAPGAIRTKNEKGTDYGMHKASPIGAEWNEQAAAMANYAIGKTVEELKNGDIDASGYAIEGTDLASSATMNLYGCVAGIEAAVANAKHLGAKTGDTLKMASIGSIGEDLAVNLDVVAVTMNGETITSCFIDAIQSKTPYEGATTYLSKNQLGADYGMVAWGGAIAEWNEQAASFCAYVTGKTPAEVSSIAVNEGTKPTDADLTASVTIAIGGFQALIAKACQ